MHGPRPVNSFAFVVALVLLLSAFVGYYFHGVTIKIPLPENANKEPIRITIHMAYICVGAFGLGYAAIHVKFLRIPMALLIALAGALFSGIVVKYMHAAIIQAWENYQQFRATRDVSQIGSEIAEIFDGHWAKAISLLVFFVVFILMNKTMMDMSPAVDRPESKKTQKRKATPKPDSQNRMKEFMDRIRRKIGGLF